MTTKVREKRTLFFGFDAFCDHRQAHCLAERNNGLCHGAACRIRDNLADEGAINFELIPRQAFKVTHRGAARTKTIQRKAHAMRFELFHLGDNIIHVVQQHALSKLKLEAFRSGSSPAQHSQNMFDEFGLAELPGTDVHGNR